MSTKMFEMLQDQLTELLPSRYKIRIVRSNNISESVVATIADMSKKSTDVTFYNSDSYVHLIMHLPSNKPAWERLSSNGLKFRKISTPTIFSTNERLIRWVSNNIN